MQDGTCIVICRILPKKAIYCTKRIFNHGFPLFTISPLSYNNAGFSSVLSLDPEKRDRYGTVRYRRKVYGTDRTAASLV